jgi:glycosyltransferase involved in cell wall biosynthesis
MDMQIRPPDLWIIVDNSTTPAHDWSIAKDRPGVLYERVYEPLTIGALRNRCLDLALAKGADIIVFWDDDDYYPPTRISTGLRALEANPHADIAGSSRMHLLLTRENVFLETGPFSEHHATAATWTLRRSYAETHRFEDKARGEEYGFTNGWTASLVQVPAEETIVVLGHRHNTVDKSDLLVRPSMYKATILNQDNGRMVVRSRWPLPWDIFRSTFCTEGCGALQAILPSEASPSARVLTPRTAETEGSAEHRA